MKRLTGQELSELQERHGLVLLDDLSDLPDVEDEFSEAEIASWTQPVLPSVIDADGLPNLTELFLYGLDDLPPGS